MRRHTEKTNSARIVIDRSSFVTVEEILEVLPIYAEEGKVLCVQKELSGGFVITFDCEATKDSFVEAEYFNVGNQRFPIRKADTAFRYVKVKFLPYQVTEEEIRELLRPFGTIHKVKRDCHINSTYRNGNITVEMEVLSPIPSYLSIAGEKALIHYRDQVRTCRLCHGTDHLAKDCRNCFFCKSSDHVFSQCPSRSAHIRKTNERSHVSGSPPPSEVSPQADMSELADAEVCQDIADEPRTASDVSVNDEPENEQEQGTTTVVDEGNVNRDDSPAANQSWGDCPDDVLPMNFGPDQTYAQAAQQLHPFYKDSGKRSQSLVDKGRENDPKKKRT